MEIQQISEQIFASSTNILAAIIIIGLTLLALFGTFSKSSNHKIRHFARQSPAILATVGIFFSFWGISIGLIGLDLNDIQNSIPKLLDGLKVKFIASLMGIGASIIVRIAQNFAVEDIIEKDNDEKIVNLLADIHNVLANSANNSPETLLQELKQQTALLDSIKSSLAGEGDSSVTTQLGKLRSDMRDSLKDMDTSNKQRSESLNSTLTSNFDNLTQKFEDFARIVAENNSKAFIEALEKAMRDFNNNITEQFGENFKELNRAVGELLKWQDNYKSHVETLTGNFEVALNSVATIQSAFSDIQTRSESFTEVSSELGGILQKLDLQLQDLNHHLKSLDQVADSAKQAFPIIEDNLTKLTAGFKKSTEQSLADITSTVETVANNLTATTNTMKSIMEAQQETLSSTSTEFKTVVNQTMNDLSQETQVSSKNLQQAVTVQLENITKSVNTQEQTLKSVGQDVKATIDKTLRDLAEQSKASIKEYERSLHEIITTQSTMVSNSIKTASTDFNRLLTENTTKSTNVLKEQTELLDKALQAELIKAIGTMGSNLASLSAKFVQDYAPLTEKLRDVVRLADDLKKGR